MIEITFYKRLKHRLFGCSPDLSHCHRTRLVKYRTLPDKYSVKFRFPLKPLKTNKRNCKASVSVNNTCTLFDSCQYTNYKLKCKRKWELHYEFKSIRTPRIIMGFQYPNHFRSPIIEESTTKVSNWKHETLFPFLEYHYTQWQ